jgi:hypothetical protein
VLIEQVTSLADERLEAGHVGGRHLTGGRLAARLPGSEVQRLGHQHPFNRTLPGVGFEALEYALPVLVRLGAIGEGHPELAYRPSRAPQAAGQPSAVAKVGLQGAEEAGVVVAGDPVTDLQAFGVGHFRRIRRGRSGVGRGGPGRQSGKR